VVPGGLHHACTTRASFTGGTLGTLAPTQGRGLDDDKAPALLRLEEVIAGTEGSGGEECSAAQGAGGEAEAWAIELLGKPLQPQAV